MSDENHEGARPRSSVLARLMQAIDSHPLPTLLLAMALVSAVLWNKVDGATAALYQATARIDTTVRDLGRDSEAIRQIQSEIKEISHLRQSMATIENSITSINNQFKSIKPFEVRVIESYGIEVNETLLVDTVQGIPMAFPLTPNRTAEIEAKRFIKTGASITRPVYAAGWAPPQAAMMYDVNRSIPAPNVPPVRR